MAEEFKEFVNDEDFDDDYEDDQTSMDELDFLDD
jgi:hypothetical protein